jgi:Domain of unknown function (DUF2760)
MMRLITAFKAFFMALKDPEKTQKLEEPSQVSAGDYSHLRLLSLMQESSRLVDFLKEDLSSFDDAQIGAAARKIHEECGRCLEDLVTVRPLMEESEGSKVTIPQGYDSSKIKVVGKVKGSPPYSGVLVHKGWKAHKRSLPKKIGVQETEVICPAEIEVR